MGQSVFPAPAAGKTMYRTTLASGTSWTVPAGVTYVNVTLVGGGGGGGAYESRNGFDATSGGGTGGTTTFTGATSAIGGVGGNGRAGGNAYAGRSVSNNSGAGGLPSMTGQPSTPPMQGTTGAVISSTLSTTPGGSITYAIGAGGAAGSGDTTNGGAGGSGKIDIEYWV